MHAEEIKKSHYSKRSWHGNMYVYKEMLGARTMEVLCRDLFTLHASVSIFNKVDTQVGSRCRLIMMFLLRNT